MMDFVPYANGSDGSSSSLSSSNLSPLAPPFFAVDWSVQNPLSFKLAGYGVPPFNPSLNSSRRNWMSSRVSNPFPEFDTVPPNSYRYSAAHRTPPPHAPPMSPYVSASTDVFSYGTQRSNAMASDFTDAKPYYPSYVPTTFPGFYDALSPPNIPFFKGLSNNDSTPSFATLPHTGSWSGIWNGLPGLEQGQGLKLAGSSGSREVNPAATSVYKDHLDLGAYASNGLNNYGETSHGGHLSENPIECAIPGHQDFKSVPEKRTGLMAFDYLKTPISGSASVLPESCPLEPSLKQIDSRVNQVTYSGSYEKGMKHPGNNPNNSILSMKFAPGLVPPGSATCSSEPIEKISSVKNGNGGSDKVYMNFACDQHNWKESFSSPSFEEKYFFPSSQHCIQLEGTDRIFAKSPSTDNDLQERSICKDALDHFFGETSGFQDSNICTDELAWALDDDKTINRDENPSKHLDHYIPHLDSPCWKGAPVPHYRSLDVLELSTLQLTKKLEGSNSYNHQGPPFCPLNIDDAAKTSSLNPSEDSVAHKSKCLYNSLASPSNRPSTSSFSSREHGPNDAMKVGSNQAEPSSIFVTQSSDDVELSKCDTLPNKSFNEDNLQPSWIFQENSEEGKLWR
ncbi:uncharacterized protein LOC110823283 [Carica papaya]|uniref:uncharacterized protein LOC110823283 n=1 Tax=Carica papaya TaxID=3649 RepID=UPI000B8CC0DF|nr:uncharacterized protein LOC110823283 [Carica papaya]